MFYSDIKGKIHLNISFGGTKKAEISHKMGVLKKR